MISLMFATALLLADGTAAAAQAAQPQAEAQKAKTDPNAMVCKREKVLGSRLPSKVCMTNQQWEDRKAQDRESLDRQQRVMQSERG